MVSLVTQTVSRLVFLALNTYSVPPYVHHQPTFVHCLSYGWCNVRYYVINILSNQHFFVNINHGRYKPATGFRKIYTVGISASCLEPYFVDAETRFDFIPSEIEEEAWGVKLNGIKFSLHPLICKIWVFGTDIDSSAEK